MSDTPNKETPRDPFEEALDPSVKPVVDPNYGGMPGLPRFPETSPEAVAVAKAEEIAEGIVGGAYQWAGNVHEYVDPFFVSNMDFGSFDHYYPFTPDVISAIQFLKIQFLDNSDDEYQDTIKADGERVMHHMKVAMALHNFLTTVKPNAHAVGCVMVYQGYKGACPVTYIRFEGDHRNPMTFCLRADSYVYFINSWFDGIKSVVRQQNAIDWCREENNTPELQESGMRRRITQLSQEWPLSWIRRTETTHPYDGLLNGDFELIDNTIETFQVLRPRPMLPPWLFRATTMSLAIFST